MVILVNMFLKPKTAESVSITQQIKLGKIMENLIWVSIISQNLRMAPQMVDSKYKQVFSHIKEGHFKKENSTGN
jgi:hypothetical protein